MVAAATELAEAGGYDAVVMKEVADRSGVALATIYRWFASKDHLLTEVLLVWGAQLASPSPTIPPCRRRGGPGRRRARAGHRRRGLAPAARVGRRRGRPLGRARPARRAGRLPPPDASWIGAAIGDDEVADRDAVTEVLEHVASRRSSPLPPDGRTPGYAKQQLASVARLLLRRCARDRGFSPPACSAPAGA